MNWYHFTIRYRLLTLVNVLINMNEQYIYYIYVLIFVNVG